MRQAPTAPSCADALDGATLVWLESPSNPALDVSDIAARRRSARGAALGASTTRSAAPLGQRPLDLGADFSIASATKHLSRPRRPPARLRRVARPGARAGAAGLAPRRPAPSPARSRPGSRTARSRRWTCGSSAPARTRSPSRELLAARDDVERRALPGPPGRSRPRGGRAARWPASARSSRSTSGARERAERFLAAARLVTDATSFGGVHSSAERRGALGRRRRAGGLHPLQRRLRGRRRPACRRRAGPGRRATTKIECPVEDWVWWMIAAGGARGRRDRDARLLPRARSRSRRRSPPSWRSPAPASRLQRVVFIAASLGVAARAAADRHGGTCARPPQHPHRDRRARGRPADGARARRRRRRPGEDRRRGVDAPAPTTRTTSSSRALASRS